MIRFKAILLDVATVLAVAQSLAHFFEGTSGAKPILRPCNVYDLVCIFTITTASDTTFSEDSDHVRKLVRSIRNTQAAQRIMTTPATMTTTSAIYAHMAQGGSQ